MTTPYDPEAGAARTDLCRLIAACYYEPGPEFAEEKVFEAMVELASRLDEALTGHARRMAGDFVHSGHEALLLDYTRLFLGPNGALAQPYESAWSPEPALMGQATQSIVQLYRDAGFETGEDFHDLPDHIACELEFLYLLLFREHQARAQGEADALAAAVGVRDKLLGDHLGKWIVPFTAAVAEGAQSVFYRELAALTARFVRLEGDRLR
jgi:TorA maturation chaperone TorD